MTPEPKVTQSDRDAAADAYCDWFATGDENPNVAAIRQGRNDGHLLVVALAKHRLAERERIFAELDKLKEQFWADARRLSANINIAICLARGDGIGMAIDMLRGDHEQGGGR